MRYRILAPVIDGAPVGETPRVGIVGGCSGSCTSLSLRAVALLLVGCLLTPAASGAQQGLDQQLPARTVIAGIGARDADDLDAVWVAELGVRFPAVRRVNWGLTASASEVPESSCPPIPLQQSTGRCPGGGWLTGLDLNLEFFYGSGIIHPYGVVSLGVGHLRLPDEGVRETSFAYATGLGLGARAGRRVWLFVEGRWRAERFDLHSAHGLAAVFGAKWGF